MRSRTMTTMALAAAMLAGAATAATAPAAANEDRRADVALVARPSSVDFWAQRSSATVRLDYYNPGNVTKIGASITAEIPAGITVRANPAPGWECFVDDFPALICNTDTALEPGQVVSPAEVVLRADEALVTGMEFGTLGFYRDPTENPADNYSTVAITVTDPAGNRDGT